MLYHGSKHDFNEFELPDYNDFTKNYNQQLGRGVYLTNSPDLAACYSSEDGYIYQVNDSFLATGQRLSLDKITLSTEELESIVLSISLDQLANDDSHEPYLLSTLLGKQMDGFDDQDISEVVQGLINYEDSDVSIINELYLWDTTNIVNSILTKKNYLYAECDKDGVRQYVVFDPQNLEIMDKQKFNESDYEEDMVL